ncbi:hypothetical protein GCM10022206_55990 [Streptomyces chiangmaiensis]
MDGRQSGGSDGFTLHEAATFMRSLGAVDAINLNGGGRVVALGDAGDQDDVPLNVPRAQRCDLTRLTWICRVVEGQGSGRWRQGLTWM